jgi:hypothetical protein
MPASSYLPSMRTKIKVGILVITGCTTSLHIGGIFQLGH